MTTPFNFQQFETDVNGAMRGDVDAANRVAVSGAELLNDPNSTALLAQLKTDSQAGKLPPMEVVNYGPGLDHSIVFTSGSNREQFAVDGEVDCSRNSPLAPAVRNTVAEETGSGDYNPRLPTVGTVKLDGQLIPPSINPNPGR